jgi:hypothetical protein
MGGEPIFDFGNRGAGAFIGLSMGRGLTGKPGLSKGPEPLLLCCEEVSELDGLNKLFELELC